MEKTFPIIEIGLEFYSSILGSLKRELILKNFAVNVADELILNLTRRKHK